MICPFEKGPGHTDPNVPKMSCYTYIYYFVFLTYVK
jgi:hypothetical protein